MKKSEIIEEVDSIVSMIGNIANRQDLRETFQTQKERILKLCGIVPEIKQEPTMVTELVGTSSDPRKLSLYRKLDGTLAWIKDSEVVFRGE